MGKGIETPMAQGRSSKIISMVQWIRTSRLSIKNSLSGQRFRDGIVFKAHRLLYHSSNAERRRQGVHVVGAAGNRLRAKSVADSVCRVSICFDVGVQNGGERERVLY